MFSQVCFIPSGGGGGWLPSMHHWSHDQGVCIRRICIHPGQGLHEVCIQGVGVCIQGVSASKERGVGKPPPILRDTVNERRYASYWNALLFTVDFKIVDESPCCNIQ